MTTNPLTYLKRNLHKVKPLRAFLKKTSKNNTRGLDSIAKRFHKEAFAKLDCMKCANCCKTMKPTWKKAEVKRAAKHVGMTYNDYYRKYLRIDKDGDLVNKSTPCQHLAADNSCRIYDVRPSDCSGFPHTDKRDFNLYIDDTHIQNLDSCPITLYTIDRIFEHLNSKQAG